MSLLKWEEVKDVMHSYREKVFLKAKVVNLNIDFIDLCEGRFWGGRNFYFDITFSIHERLVSEPSEWKYQLLAPTGIHIYCRTIEEAKEIADVMYRKIVAGLVNQIKNYHTADIESQKQEDLAVKLNEGLKQSQEMAARLNEVVAKKRYRNLKKKTEKLLTNLRNRGIEGRVHFSRLRNQYGWMFTHDGCQPINLGKTYKTAVDIIDNGHLDFYREGDNGKEERTEQRSIQQISCCGE